MRTFYTFLWFVELIYSNRTWFADENADIQNLRGSKKKKTYYE